MPLHLSTFSARRFTRCGDLFRGSVLSRPRSREMAAQFPRFPDLIVVFLDLCLAPSAR